MQAEQPHIRSTLERDGVRIGYEVYGADHSPTILLMPTWSILPSRHWKAQIAYLAIHFRVVCFDGRGSGRSQNPIGPEAYEDTEFVADAVAVLDATDTSEATVVGFSRGATWSCLLALDHPARVKALVFIGSAVGLVPGHADREAFSFTARDQSGEGWAQYNQYVWTSGGYEAFLEFFFQSVFPEPHSTKQIEDCIGWGKQIAPERLVDTELARVVPSVDIASRLSELDLPVLVIHGAADRIRPHAEGRALAEATGGTFVTIDAGGHAPHARDPVRVNRLIKDFADGVVRRPTRTTWRRSTARPKRALYLSSAIGLGHARRDVAIASALRSRRPDVQIDWLAQDPVTRLLEQVGERVHPASAWLANESAHIESESAEHDLNAFAAIRRMDEILVRNFMVFDDLVSAEPYDLVIADEAWEIDYFLHENPELKRFAFAWMTDFVGWLPMPDGGAAEAANIADSNAQMIEHRARFERVRDRSIFIGNPRDVIDDSFGPGLPRIRDWTERNYDFSGFVTGFDTTADLDRDGLRATLGLRPDDRLCVVAVGGSGVGASLLRRFLDSVASIRRVIPELTFLVVTGPRIDQRSVPRRRGVRIRGFLPDLHRYLGVADVALVQGGLSTCMELAAQRVPFVYVPLRNHFEQNLHVRHRLGQYAAGRCLSYDQMADPLMLASALCEAMNGLLDWRPVETDGAERAAALLADLL